jgi:hypothetical protein
MISLLIMISPSKRNQPSRENDKAFNLTKLKGGLFLSKLVYNVGLNSLPGNTT